VLYIDAHGFSSEALKGGLLRWILRQAMLAGSSILRGDVAKNFQANERVILTKK